MPQNHWLIGVRKNELGKAGYPRPLADLREISRGEEGTISVIRNIPDPSLVHDLQREHGKDYVEFYYVDDDLSKAATKAKIPLNRLRLVFGPPPGGHIFDTVTVPKDHK